MIPGVLRGVIASSWLRASDDLRAPNNITTGQDLPFVSVIERQYPVFQLVASLPTPAVIFRKSGVNTSMQMTHFVMRKV